MYFDLKRKKNYTWMSSLIELACHMCKISHLAASPELRSPARTKIKQCSYREEFFASLLRRGTKIKRGHKHRDLLHCYPLYFLGTMIPFFCNHAIILSSVSFKTYLLGSMSICIFFLVYVYLIPFFFSYGYFI